jgi:uncharacterized protein (TIGR04255 family)
LKAEARSETETRSRAPRPLGACLPSRAGGRDQGSSLVLRQFVYSSVVLIELDPEREIYPNAPLQLVAAEISYALAPGADIQLARDALYERLQGSYPLPGPAPASLTVAIGPGGPMPQFAQGFRFLDLERSRSVAVSSTSIILEASRYHRFEDFLEHAAAAIDALGAVVRVAAASRIGLRYIDEIAQSALPGRSFDGYFAESVLAPGMLVSAVGRPQEFLTTSRFAVGPDRNTVMRTGVLTTPVVTPDGPLAIMRRTEPPFFLVDIDSYWQAGAETSPLRFDWSAIADILHSLHAPVRALFEHSITEKLRNELLRKEMPA